MSKRKRSELTPDMADSFFELLLEGADNKDAAVLDLSRKRLMHCLSKTKVERKAAKEFTVDETVADFGLTYDPDVLSTGDTHFWRIHELCSEFEITPCIGETSFVFFSTGSL